MIGALLGDRYQLLDTIGEGGMAAVYRARDTRLDREIAVKVLHPHIARNEELCQRFQQEASIAARLEHPNIVKIYDYGIHFDGRAYIVSELIRGQNFHILQVHQVNKTKIPFEPLVCAMVCEEILKGLAAAHAQNVVHRDVKPDNIMISDDGAVKITDFGIAKNLTSSMTVAGHFLGSPSYSSPEQVQGKPVDFRSDIYAVGIILYEALTGKLPFTGYSATEVMMRIMEGRFTPAKLVRPEIPDALDILISKALAHSPIDRFQSTLTMGQEIRSYLLSKSVQDSRSGLEAYFADPVGFFQSRKTSVPGISIADVITRDLSEDRGTVTQQIKKEILLPPPPAPTLAFPLKDLVRDGNASGRANNAASPTDKSEGRSYALTEKIENKVSNQGRNTLAIPAGHQEARADANARRASGKATNNPQNKGTGNAAAREAIVNNQTLRRTVTTTRSAPKSFSLWWFAPIPIFALAFLLLMPNIREKMQENLTKIGNGQKLSPAAKSKVGPNALHPPSATKAPVPLPVQKIPIPPPVLAVTSRPSLPPVPVVRETPIARRDRPESSRPLPRTGTDSGGTRIRKNERPKELELALAVPTHKSVAIAPDDSTPVQTPTPRPTQAAPQVAKFSVQTIPAGVAVRVDDRVVGESAMGGSKTFEVQPGSHVIRISGIEIAGTKYVDYEKNIFFDAGKMVDLGLIKLQPIRTLTIKISGPQVLVRVNGDPYALTNQPLVLSLPEGRIEVEAKAQNGRTLKRNIDLRGDNYTLSSSLD
jgi:serine/threonine protein kinase